MKTFFVFKTQANFSQKLLLQITKKFQVSTNTLPKTHSHVFTRTVALTKVLSIAVALVTRAVRVDTWLYEHVLQRATASERSLVEACSVDSRCQSFTAQWCISPM